MPTNPAQTDLLPLMLSRVRDAYIRKPFMVDGDTDLVTVCRLLSEQGLTSAVVTQRDAAGMQRLGMFTTTDLRDALLRPKAPQAIAVHEVAQFSLIEVGPDTELMEALLLMIRHSVHRLLVRDGERLLGVLSQLDLMSYLSNHSHLIAFQVRQASTVGELSTAARQVDSLVALLQRGGVKTELIARLVSELNTQVFARLWTLLAPSEVRANSCLLVMGSEGRGEQIQKTDQDNALLLRDGFEHPGLPELAQRFNAALADMGYPPCPGHIMLSNPLWRQPLATFKTSLLSWLDGHDPDGPMHLAVFMDARAVTGDEDLLTQARQFLLRVFANDDALLARLAAAVEQFEEPSRWWDKVNGLLGRAEQAFDLKKLGTFPIVHGARALALKHHVPELGTTARLQVLAREHHLSPELARDLTDVFEFLSALKLQNNLRQRELGEPVHHRTLPSDLGLLQRDQLKDSLLTIRRFKQHLRTVFRLDAV